MEGSTVDGSELEVQLVHPPPLDGATVRADLSGSV